MLYQITGGEQAVVLRVRQKEASRRFISEGWNRDAAFRDAMVI